MNDTLSVELLAELRKANVYLLILTIFGAVAVINMVYHFWRYQLGQQGTWMNFRDRLMAKQGKGDYAGVIALCEAKLKKEPSDIWTMFSLGQAQFNLGHWQESIDTMNRVLTLSPYMKQALPFIRDAKAKLRSGNEGSRPSPGN